MGLGTQEPNLTQVMAGIRPQIPGYPPPSPSPPSGDPGWGSTPGRTDPGQSGDPFGQGPSPGGGSGYVNWYPGPRPGQYPPVQLLPGRAAHVINKDYHDPALVNMLINKARNEKLILGPNNMAHYGKFSWGGNQSNNPNSPSYWLNFNQVPGGARDYQILQAIEARNKKKR